MFARKRLVLHELKSRERDRPIKRSPDGGGEKLERFDRVGMESPAEEKSRPFARSQTAARSYSLGARMHVSRVYMVITL